MLRIQNLRPKELDLVEALAREIWPVCYKSILSPEQIAYMLGWMYNPDKLRADAEKGISFDLLTDGDLAAGFAAHGMGSNGVYRLEKIYVRPATQGRGYGKFLMQHVEQKAVAAAAAIVQLNVNRQNPAVAFYRHLGYKTVREEVNDIGRGFVMDDYVMEKMVK